jgi:hypothetical protein
VASIPACHAGDPGSIPGRGAFSLCFFFFYTYYFRLIHSVIHYLPNTTSSSINNIHSNCCTPTYFRQIQIQGLITTTCKMIFYPYNFYIHISFSLHKCLSHPSQILWIARTCKIMQCIYIYTLHTCKHTPLQILFANSIHMLILIHMMTEVSESLFSNVRTVPSFLCRIYSYCATNSQTAISIKFNTFILIYSPRRRPR